MRMSCGEVLLVYIHSLMKAIHTELNVILHPTFMCLMSCLNYSAEYTL
jgi:hypothetical protein